MREKILTIIEKNARLTVKDIAQILGRTRPWWRTSWS